MDGGSEGVLANKACWEDCHVYSTTVRSVCLNMPLMERRLAWLEDMAKNPDDLQLAELVCKN